jgi:hypothetical protein
MTVEPFWVEVNEAALRQGDHLPRCLVPVFGPDLAGGGTQDVTADEYDLILVTQSCDLEQRRVRLVAACPVYPLRSSRPSTPPSPRRGGGTKCSRGGSRGFICSPHP